jgi:hypothetical protein
MRRKRVLGAFATVAFLLALSSPLPAAGKHPHIEAALESLHAAKHELESAEHDFHGHRVEAVKHVDQAIKEAEICMQE